MGKRGTWSTLQYPRLRNNKRWRFWSLGRHKLLSSPSVYLPEKCINLAKVLTSNNTQSDIQSTLSRARATQNFVGFAKQSVNRKASLVRTIFFSPTKVFNNCHQKLFHEHDQPCPRCEQGYKTKNWWLQKFSNLLPTPNSILFFVVVRTGSKTDTFGKSTIFSSFEGVRFGEGTPYNGPYGEAPPESGTFFRLQVYERAGISLAEVFKRVGKSVIWVCKRAQKG